MAGRNGRDRELAELVAGLQDAIEGQGGVFLITGEAGSARPRSPSCDHLFLVRRARNGPTGARGLRQFERRPQPSERRCASPQIHIRGPQLRGVLVSSRPALRDAARSFFPKPISFRHDSAGICILTLSLQVEISRCSYIISKGDDVSRPGSVGERRPPTIVSSTHGLRPIINGITLLA